MKEVKAACEGARSDQSAMAGAGADATSTKAPLAHRFRPHHLRKRLQK